MQTRELRDSIKHNKICIIGVPEEEEMEKEAEGLFEQIITENFPDLGKKAHIQIQEAQIDPIKSNKSSPTPRYIIQKFAKYRDKENILRAENEKNLQKKTNQSSSRLIKRNLAGRLEGSGMKYST